jgi:predicted dehydrogenase
MVKLGVIGMGKMGGYHASIISTLPDTELLAIADPNEGNWQKAKGASVIKTSDFSSWLDQVDGVVIAVPTSAHYEVAKACLSAKKHILLEKPLCNNLEQAAELIKLAQDNNCALHVGHVERFNGAIQELKKIIHEPKLIECHRMGPFAPRVATDSVVLDLMIHDIDLVMNIVGSTVTNISAHGTKVYTDSCDIASVQLSFANGTIASIIASRASQIKKRSMAVHQKDAYFHLDFTTQDLSIHRHTTSSVQLGVDQLKYRQESTVEHLYIYKDNPLKAEIVHFINSMRNGTDLVTPTQDLQALEVTFEIEKILKLR